MYISKQRKFLFCHVSRTGGTSFSEEIRNSVKDAQRLRFQHLSMREAKSILGDEFDELYKFAFVRNPWERLVSWYGLLAIGAPVRNPDEQPDWEPDSPHWQKFDEFLEQASTQTIPDFRGDWLDYSQWLQLVDDEGNLLVDDIGRFENYAADSKRFLDKIGVPQTMPEKLNTSKHLHYSEYYSDFGKELVAEVFQDDVTNFGYEFETK